jgi:hypothetical protein
MTYSIYEALSEAGDIRFQNAIHQFPRIIKHRLQAINEGIHQKGTSQGKLTPGYINNTRIIVP